MVHVPLSAAAALFRHVCKCDSARQVYAVKSGRNRIQEGLSVVAKHCSARTALFTVTEIYRWNNAACCKECRLCWATETFRFHVLAFLCQRSTSGYFDDN